LWGVDGENGDAAEAVGASAFAGGVGVDCESAFEFCVGAADCAVVLAGDDGGGCKVIGWIGIER